MDVSSSYNNSEDGRISSNVFWNLFFFFQSDYAIFQPQGHWDRSACNPQSKRKREARVREASQAAER